MHAAAVNLRGGVSPRSTRLRGQSIIEYVLIIAVIGLVIVFAGPGVAGAIRNQFNLVGNTVNSGTAGGVEGGGASGGGSAGAGSATVQAAIAKDAKDWTLDEQKAVAEDIAAKGEASPAYAKAKAAMDAGTKFTMKLTNGKTLEYRIIGINLIGTLVVIAISILTYLLGEDYLADIAVVYVVLSFIAVAMLCRIYINLYDRRKEETQDDR